MNEVFDFISNNLGTISSLGSIVFSFFGCLIYIIIQLVVLVRTSKDPAVAKFILEQLPSLIQDAETRFHDGVEKKRFVFSTMTTLIKEHFPKVSVSIFNRLINRSIEEILSCPQKKEEI